METEIDGLVRQFLQEHPDFRYPPSGDIHPSILAMTQNMQRWLIERLGGYEAYWEAMLQAAKGWFAQDGTERLCRVFCARFEAEGNTLWDGNPRLESLSREYRRWRQGSMR